ncbi:tRNA synthetases class I (M)-domain-containing protein [Peziza echinospora]|nr:tRNA synthetases class I (M)-domain-containing protein [Peziza echinospora]
MTTATQRLTRERTAPPARPAQPHLQCTTSPPSMTMRLRTPLALLHRAQLTRASAPLRPSAIPSLLKQLTPSLRRHLSSEIPSTLPPFEKPFYITSPIFYVNSAPHVGHLYTLILTDVIKRWAELQGKHAVLATGTDEHGMKIQQAAAAAKQQPKEFCDSAAEIFKNLARAANISNDHFVRTSDPVHYDAVQYVWHMLQSSGHIYTAEHKGWYCVSDETFYPANAIQTIIDPSTGRKTTVSIETGKPVELTAETNYHFRLSAFQQKLIDLYKNPSADTLKVLPPGRHEYILSQLEAGPLQDLSISRPRERLTWGIPVPHDNTQTIYVWLDALVNYLTVAGYPFTPSFEHAGGWPADMHVIGKDILRFHCIYWPAFLMALDLPLPSRILTHAHWTLNHKKMSKSDGNGVNPFFAIDRFGVDTMRWYLIHDGGLMDDGDYSNEEVIERYKKQLKGGVGNLFARIMSKSFSVPQALGDAPGLMERYVEVLRSRNATTTTEGDVDGNTTTPPASLAANNGTAELTDADIAHISLLCTLPTTVASLMDTTSPTSSLNPSLALKAIFNLIAETNKYIHHAEPWKLAGNPSEQRKAVWICAETLRIAGILLQPWVPGKAREMLDGLGVSAERRGFEWTAVGADVEWGVEGGGKVQLFPRLECEE